MVKEEYLKESDVNLDFLSKDKRFTDLSGKVYGELTILGPYRFEGTALRWVAKCSCGNVVKTSRSKLVFRGKTSCVECSERKLKIARSKTLKEMVEVLHNKHPDISVTKIRTSLWKDTIEVTCSYCNECYETSYRNAYLGNKSCSCGKIRRKRLWEKYGVVSSYCEEHGYDFLCWELEGRISCVLRCRKHETILTTLYTNLEKGKICCKECSKERRVYYNSLTTDVFIERAKNVHGEGSYDYSEAVYKNSSTKVLIKCNSCGEVNLQNPANHLSGRGCKNCCKFGYQPLQPCNIYLLKLEGFGETFYKIGITKNLKNRIYAANLSSYYNLSYVKSHLLDFGWQAKDIEDKILESLETKGCVSKSLHEDGYTETFNKSEFNKVQSLLDNYIKEFQQGKLNV